MRLISICLLTLLASTAPAWCKQPESDKSNKSRWIYLDQSVKYQSISDVSFLEGAALLQQVGKRTTLTGKRVSFWGGLTGIAAIEGPPFGVSIDPVKLPKNGHIETTFTLTRYREHPGAVTIHVTETGGNWLRKRVRLRNSELEELLAPYDCGALVTVTGTLCHVTFTTIGSPPQEYFPPTPPSHFFFSVDDVVIERTKPNHK